jgi:hypothetical protein
MLVEDWRLFEVGPDGMARSEMRGEVNAADAKLTLGLSLAPVLHPILTNLFQIRK